ncbi:UspA domain-containing protein [Pseudomonas sp. BAY1663]|uniref:universal stress protein n=1 Tax=Pseudomonas sp. BAY1663 TaxID=1439940 RepID=UPI00042DF2A6|nr:universal stress protein [Pseudomonas sp. BAY1663]EXF42516.1 UspA domain-containing protein [Pseudomonas sp. BAY1663]
MVQHILVAHDLTPEADRALQRGAQLARQSGARLSLLHVLDERDNGADEVAARNRLQNRLQHNGLGDQQPWLRRGNPVEEVLTQTRGLEADLLVLGRHHRDSTQGFAGTTLERILLATPAPLLLAIAPAETPYSQALAALDFSPCATRALQCAWRLLPAGAELHALNVDEVAEVHGPDESGLALQQELFDQLLEDIQAWLPDSGVRLSYSLYQGERSNCLEAAIGELQPQLLALGGHSRGELSSALLGSLTRQFLDQPPCDVLVAR